MVLNAPGWSLELRMSMKVLGNVILDVRCDRSGRGHRLLIVSRFAVMKPNILNYVLNPGQAKEDRQNDPALASLSQGASSSLTLDTVSFMVIFTKTIPL
jgi:hypothetical protein